jgi:hypothetical protein
VIIHQKAWRRKSLGIIVWEAEQEPGKVFLERAPLMPEGVNLSTDFDIHWFIIIINNNSNDNNG